MRRTSEYTFIDLFAGCGGLSIGFSQAGFELVAATDNDKWSCESIRANHPGTKVIECDIKDLSVEDVLPEDGRGIDVIVGGPPCQGFSALGKRLDIDPRNALALQYLRFVKGLRPKIFVMENVPELLKSAEYAAFKKGAESLSYIVEERVLLTADYGAPQKRKRAIVIGSRIGLPVYPEPTHRDPSKLTLLDRHLKPWRTVREAIGDLPLEPDGKNWHIGRNPTPLSIERYKHVPEGGNRFDLPVELQAECWKRKPTGSADVFGRLWWDRPSVTIRTEFYKPEKGRYLHPVANRPITIREAARLQSFPDSYYFAGPKIEVAKQIGNAVPCIFARQIGKAVIQALRIAEKSQSEYQLQAA